MTRDELRERLERGETVVVNIRKRSPHRDAVAWAKSEGLYVPVHRPFKWGNKFIEGEDGNRDEVCEKYADWLQAQPDLLADIGELRGKALGCWCAPKRCHADELARLANAASE